MRPKTFFNLEDFKILTNTRQTEIDLFGFNMLKRLLYVNEIKWNRHIEDGETINTLVGLISGRRQDKTAQNVIDCMIRLGMLVPCGKVNYHGREFIKYKRVDDMITNFFSQEFFLVNLIEELRTPIRDLMFNDPISKRFTARTPEYAYRFEQIPKKTRKRQEGFLFG